MFYITFFNICKEKIRIFYVIFIDEELAFFEIHSETSCIFRGNFEPGQSISCHKLESLMESVKKISAAAESLISGVKTLVVSIHSIFKESHKIGRGRQGEKIRLLKK